MRVYQHTQVGHSPQLTPVSLRREASGAMSESCGPLGTSLTQDILSSLGLADKVLAVGTSEMYLCTQECRVFNSGSRTCQVSALPLRAASLVPTIHFNVSPQEPGDVGEQDSGDGSLWRESIAG